MYFIKKGSENFWLIKKLVDQKVVKTTLEKVTRCMINREWQE